VRTFLSSTYLDLAEYRRVTATALERLGQAVERMEIFGARPDEPTFASFDEVQRCDLFVGIYAHRYGHVPARSGASITEQEFDKARQLRKPLFCFVVHDDFPWPPKWVEGEPGRSRLMAFKERLGQLYVRDTFTTPDDLGLKVAAAVGRHVSSAAATSLAEQVRQRMQRAGIGADRLASGIGLTDIAGGEREELLAMLAELTDRVAKLLRDRDSGAPAIDPRSLRAAADGLLAERRWLEAAGAYEEYAKHALEDWEASYLRGVGYANARGGEGTDRRALRAVSDAIAYLPADAAPDVRARLFGYRGAMWKRLGRPEEALADLAIAQRHATAPYEVEDVLYNLACVYAIQGNREGMLTAVRTLADRHSPRLHDSIRSHLNDYFALFRDDGELLALLGG
jgi:tetratricopeptide (TPR) repeat protein